MPRYTWDTKADWDGAYRVNLEQDFGWPASRDPVTIGYLKSVRTAAIERIASYYETALGPAAFSKFIVIVGGAFGWVAEELAARGFTQIVVADTGAYVQAEKANSDETEIRAAISAAGLDPDSGRGLQILNRYATTGQRQWSGGVLNADVLTSAGRNLIAGQFPGQPDIVVTEDVLTSLSDAEAVTLHNACDAFSGQQTIAHLVTTLDPEARQDPAFNWKTLAEWKTLLPDSVMINAVTGEVL